MGHELRLERSVDLKFFIQTQHPPPATSFTHRTSRYKVKVQGKSEWRVQLAAGAAVRMSNCTLMAAIATSTCILHGRRCKTA